ncbi:MAG: hypothetical protein ACE5KA_03775 [Nitrososphaerales archaeon]
MNSEELVEQASQEGLVYIPSEKKFVSASLQAAVSKFGTKKILLILTPARIKLMIGATRSNYRNIKRMCDTTQDPSYCYMAEAILPYLEAALEEFEQGINIAKPLKIYSIDESNKAGEVLLEIYRPHEY